MSNINVALLAYNVVRVMPPLDAGR